MPNILITGASGSIGQALALQYAAPQVTLVLQGRNVSALESLRQQCEARGANVVIGAFDITEIGTLRQWVSLLEQTLAFDILVVNQGVNINIGSDGKGEAWEDTDQLLNVNLRAAIALVQAVLPGMRERKKGQVVLVSSLAAYFGLPMTPAYCASKAALKSYGESLRGWLSPEGVGVSVVLPGYVQSDMSAAMPGPKPWLWTAERAAKAIKEGVSRNQATISFPFPLNVGTWLLSVLPMDWSIRLLRWMGYRA
jgi:short-subunit dehydrogenase